MPLSFGILCLMNLGEFRIMMVLKFNLRHIFLNLHLFIDFVLLFIVFDYNLITLCSALWEAAFKGAL